MLEEHIVEQLWELWSSETDVTQQFVKEIFKKAIKMTSAEEQMSFVEII